MSRPPARTAAYAVAGAVPWLVWLTGLYALQAIARSGKDASAYTGTCIKPNGYAVNCTLDQWQLWDAALGLNLYIFIGGIAAAALSGWVYLRYRLRSPG